MQFAVLFSGSSGNASYIKIGDVVYIIDIGVSMKRFVSALHRHNIQPETVCGVFLTHEHRDHILGIKRFCETYQKPLYAYAPTIEVLPKRLIPNDAYIHILDETTIRLCDMDVLALPTSHDAAYGVGFVFTYSGKKLVYLTDTGYVSDTLQEQIRDADAYIIESNHEPELVLQSRYPWHVRRRILSDTGHLSNHDCAHILKRSIGPKTRHIILAHLSEENNKADIALHTLKNILCEHDCYKTVQTMTVAHRFTGSFAYSL